MANQGIPDFNLMAANIQNIAQEQASLAMQVDRMQNLPAFDAEGQILQALAHLVRHLDHRFGQIDLRLAASDYNWLPRRQNSLASQPWVALTPLRTPRNERFEQFPADKAAIEELSENQINLLINIYGLSMTGDIEQRKRRFSRYIGIMTVGME